MAERSAISQGIQVGVETVEGTAVAANKKLSSLSIVPSPNMEFSSFSPAGNKFDTLSILNREWSNISLDGYPTYTELIYALSMLMGAATVTTPVGATNARQWEFTINATSDDPPKSLTIERGDSNLAEKVAGAVLNALTIGFSRTSDPSLSGDGFARQYQTGATLTASPTTIPLVPVLPKDVCVYVDAPGSDPEAALGTTKLTRCNNYSFAVGSRFSNFWALDCAQDSYVATLETKPTTTIELGVMADSTGMGFLANARAGDTRMVRIEADSGVEIDTGVATSTYRLTIDAAIKFSSVGDLADQDGAMVLPYTGTIVFDPTWGKAFRVQLVNNLTAL